MKLECYLVGASIPPGLDQGDTFIINADCASFHELEIGQAQFFAQNIDGSFRVRNSYFDIVEIALLNITHTDFFPHPSVVDNPNRIRNTFNLRKNVAGNHNGYPVFRTECFQQITDLLHPSRIKAVGWFIQNEKFRFAHDGPRNSKALLHAQRIAFDWLVGGGCQIQNPQRILHAVDIVIAHVLPVEPQIFPPGHVVIKGWKFDHAAHPFQHLIGFWC